MYAHSSPTFNVAFSADYSPAGRLGHNFCVANYVNKQLTYGYDINGLTHQPRVIYDKETEQSYDLYWDANGNLAQVVQCDYSEVRFHEWDDSNRLHAVIGPNQAGFYGYDGNGDRVWKLMGKCRLTSQNGGNYTYSAFLDDAVLYPNPYITITPQGYTKHFYVGTERIATALGEGGWNNVIRTLSDAEIKVNIAYIEHFYNLPCEKYPRSLNGNIEHIWMSDLQYSCDSKCMSRINITSSYNLLLNCVNGYQHSTGYPETTYFTHSDHLGSASWITDDGAHPVQYIHYAPYGELIANQRSTTFDERYKFTGKERDAESGYDYFGARYLLSDAGIWLSVDPLADKYPGISPYAYCNWNPIKYVDPDGRYFDEANEGTAQKIEAECQQKLATTRNLSQKKELNKTLQDIKDMRGDENHEYKFKSVSGSDGEINCDGTNDKGHQVVTMSANFDKIDGLTAHEVRHGGQVARGEWFYNGKTPENYGVMKEVDAYKAQWGWDGFINVYGLTDLGNGALLPGTLKPSYNEINSKFVNSITNGLSFELKYPPVGLDIKLWNNH